MPGWGVCVCDIIGTNQSTFYVKCWKIIFFFFLEFILEHLGMNKSPGQ